MTTLDRDEYKFLFDQLRKQMSSDQANQLEIDLKDLPQPKHAYILATLQGRYPQFKFELKVDESKTKYKLTWSKS